MTIVIYITIAILILYLQLNLKREYNLFIVVFWLISFLFLYLNYFPSVSTFTNANKYVIADVGYKFSKSLELYGSLQNESTDTSYDDFSFSDSLFDINDNSIFGNKYGQFIINMNEDSSVTFNFNNFSKPLYIPISKRKYFFKKNESDSLINPFLNQNFKKNITLYLANNTILKLSFDDKSHFCKINYKSGNFKQTVILDKLDNKNLLNKLVSRLNNDFLNNHFANKKSLKLGYPLMSFIIDNYTLSNDDNIDKLSETLKLLNNFLIIRTIKNDLNANLALIGNLDSNVILKVEMDNKIIPLNNNLTYRSKIDNSINFNLGYVKNKTDKYVLLKDKNSIILKNLNIKYYPIFSENKTGEYRMFITSNPATLTRTAFNKGIFILSNNNPESINHIDASFSYSTDKSNNDFELMILDHNKKNKIDAFSEKNVKISDEKEFDLNTKGGYLNLPNNVSRIFKLKNIEKSSVFKPAIGFIVLFAFGVVVLLLLNVMNKSKVFYNKKNNYTLINFNDTIFPISILLLAFITIKLFLLWRTSVFLPFADLTYELYNNQNNPTYLIQNMLFPLAVFLIIAFVKKYDIKSNFIHKLLNNNYKPITLFKKCSVVFTLNENKIGILLLINLIFIFLKLSGILKDTMFERFLFIYFPIIFYFITIYFIYTKIESLKLNSNIIIKIEFDELKKIIISILNVFYFVFFLFTDAGFSIIFILFLLINNVFQFFFLEVPPYHSSKNNFKISDKVLPQISFLILFLFASNYLVSIIFDYFIYFYISIIISVLLASFYLLFYKLQLLNKIILFFHTDVILKIFLQKNKLPIVLNKKKSGRIFSIIFILVFLLTLFSNNISKNLIDKFIHIKYRAQILTKDVEEIIQFEEFGKYKSKKIVATAENKWFLSYFSHKGSNTPSLSLKEPYTLQTHFKHGVSYITQTTDVLVSRYLIGEHGTWSPIVLVLLLLITTVVLFKYSSNLLADIKSYLACSTLTLLTTIATFVWLTATNKFIFFGQDFPFLSLQSKMSPFLFFTSLSAIILFYKSDIIPTNNQASLYLNNKKKTSNKVIIIFIIIMICIPMVRYSNNYNDFFSLADEFNKTERDFSSYNQKLMAVQTEDSSHRLNINSLISDNSLDPESSIFSKSLYNNLKVYLSNNKTSLNLKKINKSGDLGPLILKMDQDSILQIKFENNFYDLPSPDNISKRWKGNLVAKNIDKSSSLSEITNFYSSINILYSTTKKIELNNQASNVQVHILPSNWFVNEEHDIVILDLNSGEDKNNKGKFKIHKANQSIKPTSSTILATCLLSDDIIDICNSNDAVLNEYLYSEKNIKYFAKNLWINGTNRYYYPLDNNFIFAYNFVENLKSDSTLYKENSKTIDIELSIDYNLQNDLHKILNNSLVTEYNNIKTRIKAKSRNKVKNAMNKSVIVATANGDILAMADAKFIDKNLRLSPNDYNSISNTRIQLTSYFNPKDEEKVFGNCNFLKQETGPASTFKPILFSAITSQHYFNWKEIQYLPPLNYDIVCNNFKSCEGNKDCSNSFKLFNTSSLLTMDNNVYNHAVNNDEYLYQSRNSYHTIVTFLGSLNDQTIKKKNEWLYTTNQNTNESFPRFSFEGNSNTGFIYNPKFIDFREGSYMRFGLSKMYGLPTIDGADGISDDLNMNISSFNAGTTASIWVKPSPSYFYMSDRIELDRAMRQVIAGGAPIYTTPVKMAEMYGKLFSGNVNFSFLLAYNPNDKVKLDNQKSKRQEEILLPPNYNNSNNNQANKNLWYNFLSEDVFSPLAKVITDGTARELKQYIPEILNNYYLYAKTGTSGDQIKFNDKEIGEDIKLRNKHLALIISQNKLDNTTLNYNTMSKNKFLVIYFTNHNTTESQAWNDKKQILQTIMNSDFVKNYFSQNY